MGVAAPVDVGGHLGRAIPPVVGPGPGCQAGTAGLRTRHLWILARRAGRDRTAAYCAGRTHRAPSDGWYGTLGWIRTSDSRLRRPPLFPLSYEGVCGAGRRTRTSTVLPPTGFEPAASAISPPRQGLGRGGGIRTLGLLVMGQASCHCSTPLGWSRAKVSNLQSAAYKAAARPVELSRGGRGGGIRTHTKRLKRPPLYH